MEKPSLFFGYIIESVYAFKKSCMLIKVKTDFRIVFLARCNRSFSSRVHLLPMNNSLSTTDDGGARKCCKIEKFIDRVVKSSREKFCVCKMKRWEIRKLNSCAVKTLSSQFIATDNGDRRLRRRISNRSSAIRLLPFDAVSSSRHKNTIRSLKKLIFLSAARFHVSKCLSLSPYLFSNHIKHWELPRSLLSNLLHAEIVENVKKVLLRE